MEKQLPKNWIETKISEIAVTSSGGTPSTTKKEYWDGNIPWINSGKLKDEYIYEPSRFITELGLKESSAKLFPVDTVVIALTGATTGKLGYLKLETTTNQSVTGIFPNKFINSKLLFYQLRNLRTEILSQALGSAQPHINKKIVDETIIKFPPLSEQNRIVAKLDALFAQLETIKTSMAKVPLLLKDFRQQVLKQAVTGKLTEEWRKGKELEEWELKKIDEISDSLSGFAFKSSDFVETGIQLIRMGNLYNNRLDLNRNPVFLPVEYNNKIIEKYSLKKNDILLSLTGTKYKRDYGFAIKIETEEKLLLNQRIIALRPKIDVDYFLYLLRDNLFRDQFFSYETGGVNQGNVGTKAVLSIKLQIPPIEEQQEIVSRVESLFAKADAIEMQYETLKAKIDSLPQAILHKAFKGELTQQLDSDGDARELLKEIEGLKAVSDKTLKSKKTKSVAKKVKSYVEKDEVLGMVAED